MVDHLAKPFIKQQQLKPWKQQLQQLAMHENVYCKVSGMVVRIAVVRYFRKAEVPQSCDRTIRNILLPYGLGLWAQEDVLTFDVSMQDVVIS